MGVLSTTRLSSFSRNAPLPVRGNRNLRESWAATNPGPRCAPSPRPPFLYASSGLKSEAHDVSSSSHGSARGWTVNQPLFPFSSCGRRPPVSLLEGEGQEQRSFAREMPMRRSMLAKIGHLKTRMGSPFLERITTYDRCVVERPSFC